LSATGTGVKAEVLYPAARSGAAGTLRPAGFGPAATARIRTQRVLALMVCISTGDGGSD
jgi:hypothetical protein